MICTLIVLKSVHCKNPVALKLTFGPVELPLPVKDNSRSQISTHTKLTHKKEHHTRSSEGHFSCHWNMTNKVVFWRCELTRHELCIRGIEQKGDLGGTAFITTALQLCGGNMSNSFEDSKSWYLMHHYEKSSGNFFQSFQHTTDSLTHNKWKTCNHYKIVFLLQ